MSYQFWLHQQLEPESSQHFDSEGGSGSNYGTQAEYKERYRRQQQENAEMHEAWLRDKERMTPEEFKYKWGRYA